MSQKIGVLPESLIQKIAAGEVIERPASIAKELIENAIDAGAKRIEIRTGDGGRKSISVTDDGCGMSPTDALLATKRHTTSKINSLAQLEKVGTYGFRGEALSSIAAVAHVDLLTRSTEEQTGVRIRVEGGVLRANEPYGMPPGTTVAVNHLFFNTPARKKFLKARSTEFGHIDNVVRRVGLGETKRAFFLENEGEIALNLPAAGDLKERLRQLYGKELSNKLFPFQGDDGDLSVEGYCSDSHISFSRAQEIWLYVNGRPVKDRVLQAAVSEGYRTAVMERRYPLVVCKITLPPEWVDVNVHPAKAEVRFSDSQRVFRLIADSLKSVIGQSGSILMSRDQPLRQEPQYATVGESSVPYGFQGPSSSLGMNHVADADSSQDVTIPYLPAIGEEGPYSSLEVLGTLDDTYVICRGPKALVLFDQHAAHERILFEQFKSGYELEKPDVQHLLVPLTLELTAERESALSSIMPFLQKLGFELEPFGSKTYVIKSIPALIEKRDPRMLLQDIADEINLGESGTSIQNQTERALMTLACHSAVRAHDRLSQDEIKSLLKELDRTVRSTNCPHGRPTFIKLTTYDLERQFRRR